MTNMELFVIIMVNALKESVFVMLLMTKNCVLFVVHHMQWTQIPTNAENIVVKRWIAMIIYKIVVKVKICVFVMDQI